jgi:hypothetical protein
MQGYSQVGKPRHEEILGPPPRSGHVSVYAQKLTGLAFVWLCSIVVWGHTANIGSALRKCGNSCRFQIVMGVVTWLFSSVLLLFNYLCERGSMARTGFFSHGLEVQLIAVLALLWIPLVGAVSAVKKGTSGFSTPTLTVWFAWLGFFASLYGTFKAYHSFKEEDLPTPIPSGFDEEDIVYG